MSDPLGRIIAGHVRAWGASLDERSPGWSAYEARVAAAVAYHAGRFAESGIRRTTEEVVALLEKGVLAYGRFPARVLRDVALAEAFLQGDEGAARLFRSEYGPVIVEAARRAGGELAVQELDGFETSLILEREDAPPRLALYKGYTPLRDWLRRVVANEWLTFARRGGRRKTVGLGGDLTGRTVEADDGCLEILRPLFVGAVADLDAEDALLLRLTLLDEVPQSRVAERAGVNKSTIHRRLGRACEDIQRRFLALARSSTSGDGVGPCLDWLLGEATGGRLVMADHLADAVRNRAT